MSNYTILSVQTVGVTAHVIAEQRANAPTAHDAIQKLERCQTENVFSYEQAVGYGESHVHFAARRRENACVLYVDYVLQQQRFAEEE